MFFFNCLALSSTLTGTAKTSKSVKISKPSRTACQRSIGTFPTLIVLIGFIWCTPLYRTAWSSSISTVIIKSFLKVQRKTCNK